jgi:hypothetical protein
VSGENNNEIRPRTSLERVFEAMFGPDGEPEKGIKKRLEALEETVRPIDRLFRGARWPLGILGAGLLTWGLNWVISAVRMIGELLP